MKKTAPKNNQKQQNIQISPKKTLLEQLYDRGWLDFPKSPYTSLARLRVGLKLMYNYQIIQRSNLHSGFIVNSRIDIALSLDARIYNDSLQFYRNCLRIVPAEFWPVVRLICLEEKMPEIPSELSERQQAHINYLYKIDLCRGLDRIISDTTKNR